MLTIHLSSEYQMAIATRLTEEGLGKLKFDDLVLEDHEVYSVSHEQLKILGIDNWFDGILEIGMTSSPKKHFSFDFYKSNSNDKKKKLRNIKVDGCKLFYDLKTNPTHYALLPHSMFELIDMISNLDVLSNNTEAEANFWNIIDKAKNANDNCIKFVGLPNSDVVAHAIPVAISLHIDSDLSATVSPYISSLTDTSNEKYKYRLLESQSMQVLSEVRELEGDKYQFRLITDEKTINAYQRIDSIGKISPENVDKFLKNPASFVLQDDESTSDFPIVFDSYRITGMGLPYIGYFGSSILDESPLTNALLSQGHDETINNFKKEVESIFENIDRTELTEIKQKIKTAQMCQREQLKIKVDGDQNEVNFSPVTYPIAFDIIEDLLRGSNSLSTDKLKQPKVVLNIETNDEHEVFLEHNRNKPLSEINAHNFNQSDVFDDIKCTSSNLI